jgi:hypothetical protein
MIIDGLAIGEIIQPRGSPSLAELAPDCQVWP